MPTITVAVPGKCLDTVGCMLVIDEYVEGVLAKMHSFVSFGVDIRAAMQS